MRDNVAPSAAEPFATRAVLDHELAILFVGSIVPDTPEYDGVAFSRAGNMFLDGLLSSLVAAGADDLTILSQRPIRLFPRSKRLIVRGGRARTASGLEISLLGFLNVPPLRPLTVGLGVLIRAVRWTWQRRGRPRIIYTFNLTEPPGILTLLAARITGAVAVASIGDVNVPGQTLPNSLARRIDFALQRFLMPRFDGLLVASDLIAQDFAPRTPALRVAGAVPAQALSVRTRHRPPDDGLFVIAMAGSLTVENGIPEMLAAFAVLPEPDWRLRIAGAGPFASAVMEAAAKDERIAYLGYCGFDQVQQLYADADVLVNMRLTKRVNTRYFFPSKTFEYLASGIPVISTAPAHLAQELGTFVFLVEDETGPALSAMLRHVRDLPAGVRSARAQAARRHALESLTWAAVSGRIMRFLRSLAAAPA